MLGGLNNEWSYIINGPCITELSGCIELAGPKQVVASRDCYKYAIGMSLSKGSEFEGMKGEVVFARRCKDSTSYIIDYVMPSDVSKEQHKDEQKRGEKSPISLQNPYVSDDSNCSSPALSIRMPGRLLQSRPVTPSLTQNILEALSRRDSLGHAYERGASILEINTKVGMMNEADVKIEREERDKRRKQIESNCGNKYNTVTTITDTESDTNIVTSSTGIKDGDEKAIGTEEENAQDEKDSALLEAAEYFIPLPALRAIYSGSLQSIAEIRRVTSLFLRLDSYYPEENLDPISLQPFFYLLQQVLAETGGFLRQFLVDDKVP